MNIIPLACRCYACMQLEIIPQWYQKIVLSIKNQSFDIIKQMITLINNSCIKQAHKLHSIVNSKISKINNIYIILYTYKKYTHFRPVQCKMKIPLPITETPKV